MQETAWNVKNDTPSGRWKFVGVIFIDEKRAKRFESCVVKKFMCLKTRRKASERAEPKTAIVFLLLLTL